MPKYSVMVTRSITESAIIVVDAKDPLAAEGKAIAEARRYPDEQDWTVVDDHC